MDFSRRSLFGGMFAAAIGGKEAAATLVNSVVKSQFPRAGIGIAGSLLSGDPNNYGDGETDSSGDVNDANNAKQYYNGDEHTIKSVNKLFSHVMQNGFPEYLLREAHMHAEQNRKYSARLDGDLEANKSFSKSTKLAMQQQRDIDQYLRKLLMDAEIERQKSFFARLFPDVQVSRFRLK
jgi:hypothetical protein